MVGSWMANADALRHYILKRSKNAMLSACDSSYTESIQWCGNIFGRRSLLIPESVPSQVPHPVPERTPYQIY